MICRAPPPLLALLALLPLLAAALRIPTDPAARYTYAGCFNETTETPGSTHTRALPAATLAGDGYMTAPICMDFCHNGGRVLPSVTTSTQADPDGRDWAPYRYAGLEYSRECWCADEVSVVSHQYNDAYCDLPCDGDKSTSCGGELKLSVYELDENAAQATAASSNSDDNSDSAAAALLATGPVAAAAAAILGFALAM